MKKEKTIKRDTIYTSIVIKSPQRKTSDVKLWRNALMASDMGRHKQLYDLYEDLLIDGILSDAVSKRMEALCNSELTFVDQKGESVKEMAELMDTLAWEELLKAILSTLFYGRSAVEMSFNNGFHVDQFPAKHVSLETQSILLNDYDESGITYVNDSFILALGKPKDRGLLLKTAPFAIWKRGGFGDYAQWLEIFGMPQRVGKYSSYDAESRKLLEEALSKAGSAPWVVIPKESEVETVNNTGNGSSGTSYNDFRKACNEEMLITILGQTMTTLQGDKGARSLGEVHKIVEEGKNRSDMRFVQRVLNTYLKPMLMARGLNANGAFVFPEAVEQLSVNDLSSLSKIIKIPASFIYNKYGIPVPKANEEVAGEQKTQDPIMKKVDPKKKDEPVEDFFVQAPAKIGALSNLIARFKRSITGNVTAAIDVNKLIKQAIYELYHEQKKQKELINKNLFEVTYTKLQIGINRELLQVEDTDFVNQFRTNTAVFSAFKNHQQTKEIVSLLIDEQGNLRSFSKFRKLALQISEKYNVQWLQTEYNTAVRAARSAANFKQYQKTAHLYPNLEYILSSAVHRRVSHEKYAGTILPISHPWWKEHMPPSDWNCQCSVRQTDKEITPVPGEELVNPAFANNPGESAKFTVLEESPYYTNTDAELRDEIIDQAASLQKQISEKVFGKKYEGKNGGYVNIIPQNKNEYAKNVKTYKLMADIGGKYDMLEVTNIKGIKNPDAFNVESKQYSDAKHPQSNNGINAIYNSIKSAANQNVGEVIIRLDRKYPSSELYNGIKKSLGSNRYKSIKTIIIIRKEEKPLIFDVEKLMIKLKK